MRETLTPKAKGAGDSGPRLLGLTDRETNVSKGCSGLAETSPRQLPLAGGLIAVSISLYSDVTVRRLRLAIGTD